MSEYDVIADADAAQRAADALAGGHGPVAVDVERASGFRYHQRAYLIQVFRRGAGVFLLDPPAIGDFTAVQEAIGDAEWILHAASQDLPSLHEAGLEPPLVFDTELASRLLGHDRVGLGAVVERALGIVLAKAHSAVDWSTRPLPPSWLEYAALDVLHLVDVRDVLVAELAEQGKTEWAAQEFAHLIAQAQVVPPPRPDPWRRTSGLHAVHSARALAVVRELWTMRDQLASSMDRAPGKILPDRAISGLAARLNSPEVKRLGPQDLSAISEFSWRAPSRYRARWLAALDRAAALTRDQLPPKQLPSDGPPPPRTWETRNPEAAQRWNAVRPAVVEAAERLQLPVENLISPDALRRVLWQPPSPLTAESLDAAFEAELVRPWQRELVIPLMLTQLA